ncbi:hypothetical protein JCM13664_21820 [Methylothermus subterraneus]
MAGFLQFGCFRIVQAGAGPGLEGTQVGPVPVVFGGAQQPEVQFGVPAQSGEQGHEARRQTVEGEKVHPPEQAGRLSGGQRLAQAVEGDDPVTGGVPADVSSQLALPGWRPLRVLAGIPGSNPVWAVVQVAVVNVG